MFSALFQEQGEPRRGQAVGEEYGFPASTLIPELAKL